MPIGRNPHDRRILHNLSSVKIAVLLLLCLCCSPALFSQPEQTSLVQSSGERERLFRNGEYFRASHSDLNPDHSWRSSEQLLRSEAAIYAGLRHSAFKDLNALDANRINRHYKSAAALRLGWIALKEAQYGQARLYLNDAVAESAYGDVDADLQPVAGEALFWIGISHLMESGRGGYEQASRALQMSVQQYPTSSRGDDALYYLGQLAEARTEYSAALDLYADLLDRYPQSEYRVTSGVRRAQLLTTEYQYDEALLQLEETETLWAWHKSGHTETSQNHIDQVEFELVLLRGEISIGKKDLPSAERAYLTLLYTLDGAYHRDGMLGLAETYRAAGQTDSVIAIYERIIAERVDDRPGMTAEYFRAVLLSAANRSEEDHATAHGVLLMIAGDDDHLMNDQARLTLGDRAYRDGDYLEAARLSRNAVEHAQSSRIRSRAHLLLGASLMELNNYSEAASEFKLSRQAAANIPEIEMPERTGLMDLASRLEGISLFWGKNYAGAIEILEDYLRQHPDSAHIPAMAWLLGEAFYNAGRYGDAVRTMESVVEHFPSSSFADASLYTTGWAHFQKKNFIAAQGAFGRLVKAYPLSSYAAESQIRRGDCFYLHKEFLKAAGMYAQVAGLNPTPAEQEYAAYQEAIATWQAGDTVTARRDFSLFVANNGNSIWADDALFMTGLIDYRSSDYQGAIAVMRRLLDTYTDSRLHARAYYTIGDSYYRMREFDNALAAYSIVTERYPESTYMKDAETGIVYVQAAQQKQTDTEQMGVLRVAEVDGRPSYEMELRRAQIFVDANRIDDAEDEYNSFIERYPESRNLPAGFLGLAECALLRSDTIAAINTLSSLVETFTEGSIVPMAALRLTDLHLAEKDTVRAIETLSALRTNFPETAAVTTALLRETELLLATGNNDAARDLLHEGAMALDSVSGHHTRSGAQILTQLAGLEAAAGLIDSVRLRWGLLAEREDSVAAQALLNIGNSFLEEENSQEAINAYSNLLNRFSADTTILTSGQMGLAKGYERAGELEKATVLYQEIVARHKDDRYGKEASSRLGEMQKP